MPPAGTALVFSGCITHAAVRLTNGERCVLVCSFSPAAEEEETAEKAEGAAEAAEEEGSESSEGEPVRYKGGYYEDYLEEQDEAEAEEAEAGAAEAAGACRRPRASGGNPWLK